MAIRLQPGQDSPINKVGIFIDEPGRVVMAMRGMRGTVFRCGWGADRWRWEAYYAVGPTPIASGYCPTKAKAIAAAEMAMVLETTGKPATGEVGG
jgi:hypothetical protein